jgi:hypothetical protein
MLRLTTLMKIGALGVGLIVGWGAPAMRANGRRYRFISMPDKSSPSRSTAVDCSREPEKGRSC